MPISQLRNPGEGVLAVESRIRRQKRGTARASSQASSRWTNALHQESFKMTPSCQMQMRMPTGRDNWRKYDGTKKCSLVVAIACSRRSQPYFGSGGTTQIGAWPSCGK